jgi:hypothetical protein
MLFGVTDRVVHKDNLAAGARVDQVTQDQLSYPAKAVKCNPGHRSDLVRMGARGANGIDTGLQRQARQAFKRQFDKG